MISWWMLLTLSVGYVGLLFAIAYWGDGLGARRYRRIAGPAVYSLTIAVYCTSWTFYGAVGSAANDGWSFLPIYLGPALVFLFGWGMIRRIVAISKRQNLTSIADFIAARYGKARSLAVLVTIIAIVGSVPYIALQLKAVVAGFDTVSDLAAPRLDTALVIATALALFAILFGTRQIDASEHHHGMMLAIAFESVVKLAAFVAVGVLALAMLGDGAGVTAAAAADPFAFDGLPQGFVTQTLLASAAIFCLPRQFHVAVVEAREDVDNRAARWMFPLYLLVFCVFIVPITYAGLGTLTPGSYSGDTFVLALPMQGEHDWLTALAFLGGFSAATGMVIVASVTLSTMVSNEIVLPMLLRMHALGEEEGGSYPRLLLLIRRLAIIGIALIAYGYYRVMDQSTELASIGLLSFAAAAQFAPLIVLGIYWPRATRLGAIAGLGAGFLLWSYTLLLPSIARTSALGVGIVEQGPFGLDWLRPESLLVDLSVDPLTHGVMWSLGTNLTVLVIASLLSRQSLTEKIQARAFGHAGRRPANLPSPFPSQQVLNGDLLALAGRFLGEVQARHAFEDFAAGHGMGFAATAKAERRTLQFTERLLAGAIGAASARVVMTTALRRTGMEIGDVVLLLDETSQAIRFNRRLLEAALENLSQGVSVVDASGRLIGWNTRYAELMAYPHGLLSVGKSVTELMRFNASRGRAGAADVEKEIARRARLMRDGEPLHYETEFGDGRVIDISGQPIPGGGYVITYNDITDRRRAELDLVEAKAQLEQRVEDRTAELRSAMIELEKAKGEAEEANTSKTRFLAAAAHDLLQPLNAARLFAALLGEKSAGMTEEQRRLVSRVESGLIAVEDLLSALLDISRLDTRAPTPVIEAFPVADLFTALREQFGPSFAEQGLQLRFARTSLWVRSDPALLRRILQNFVSNARRYTPDGGVLVGCRRRGGEVAIQVYDTGVGIAPEHQKSVFEEFRRLAGSDRSAKRGLGLGLAIVRRIAKLLGHEVSMRSTVGRGSRFEIIVPGAEARARPVIPPRRESGLTSSLDGQYVLCVDNEADILEGMQGLLSRWGAKPLPARDLAEACDALERLDGGRQPAVLLVDFHLDDEVTGIGVIEALRERTGVHLPAVILTADHSPEVADAVRAAGHAMLHKPVKPAALRALVSRIVARREVA